MTFRPAESIYTYISPNDAETLTPPLALCLAARFDVNGVLRGVRHSLMRKCGSVRSCGARIHDRGGDLLLLVAGGLSRGDLVLVRESAEDLFPADPVLAADIAAAQQVRQTFDAPQASPKSMSRFRACWMTQDQTGCSVAPRTRTR